MTTVTDIDLLSQWPESTPAALRGDTGATRDSVAIQAAPLARASDGGRADGGADAGGSSDANAAGGRLGGVPIRLDGLSKSFGDRPVLRGIDLQVGAGEFVAIIGRSGCGKSTLLRLLAGLDQPSAGTLAAGGTAGTRFMFQDARLLPWARVVDNVSLGLKGPEARDRALQALADVGLADRAHEWPARLSGGQRQRVALARALVHTPRLLLLDEPLGALDALTRIDMQRLIERLWQRQGFTALLVTHDVSEAVALADRVLLIEEGQLALDLPVDLPRPRLRDAAFAQLEQRLLDRVLRIESVEAAPLPHSVPAPMLRWAV